MLPFALAAPVGSCRAAAVLCAPRNRRGCDDRESVLCVLAVRSRPCQDTSRSTVRLLTYKLRLHYNTKTSHTCNFVILTCVYIMKP